MSVPDEGFCRNVIWALCPKLSLDSPFFISHSVVPDVCLDIYGFISKSHLSYKLSSYCYLYFLIFYWRAQLSYNFTLWITALDCSHSLKNKWSYCFFILFSCIYQYKFIWFFLCVIIIILKLYFQILWKKNISLQDILIFIIILFVCFVFI